MKRPSYLHVCWIVVVGLVVVGCDGGKTTPAAADREGKSPAPTAPAGGTSGTSTEGKTAATGATPEADGGDGHGGADVVYHTGMCDASAAIGLSGGRILVANDEDNVLRLYAIDAEGGPIDTFDVSDQIGTHDESDLEAATRLGDRVYWIASHGRKKSGKFASSRNKFFATSVTDDGGTIDVQPVGRAYDNLLRDLLQTPGLEATGLAEASRLDQQKVPILDPKKSGVNIEGLAPTSDGKGLVLGFRNPIPRGKAILIALLNPAEVVDSGATAKFGKPVFLDLGGLGIRGLEYSAEHGGYLISAGPHDASSRFAIYLWSGKPGEAAKKLADFHVPRFAPEGLVVFPDRREVLLVSDDGALKVGGVECKSLPDPQRRKFKTAWFRPEQ